MKIAVSAMGNSLDAMVDPRFGRCPYFVIAEVENNEIKGSKSIENPAVKTVGGAGVMAAQLVAGEGVEAIITGNVGPNAYAALSNAGIKIMTGVGGVTVKNAVEMYLKGDLKETTQPTTPGFGPGGGTGAGRGFGRR